jgi:2-oxoglutarate dehydrogenase E2 component (dihydrolipoamide succinyltransferase)
MKVDVVIPSVGESISTGIISAWLVKDGDSVENGQDVMELETDKATMAVPATTSGIISISVAAGEEVSIGQVVAVINENAQSEVKKDTELSKPAKETAEKVIDDLSPAVRRLVHEYNLDPVSITGTGKDGRITKEDVILFLETSGIDKKDNDTVESDQPSNMKNPDIQTSVNTSSVSDSKLFSVESNSRQTRKPMSQIRKTIAKHLVNAQAQSAHLTTFNEINMEHVIETRNKYKEAFLTKYGIKLGFMSYFVKACCNALEEFPAVNAFIDGTDIVYNNYYDIGVAVSTERGLLVPVIRNADKKGFAEIEQNITELAGKARDKKITLDELSGGTFSITNGGIFGSMLSTPIPNFPQSAILGMHSITERPVAVNGEVFVKPVMYVALTYDHRIIDGREAVTFLQRIKEYIEDPERICLAI